MQSIRNNESTDYTKGAGKVWFVTGAGRGIGAEIARAALAAGDQVVATGATPNSCRLHFLAGTDAVKHATETFARRRAEVALHASLSVTTDIGR